MKKMSSVLVSLTLLSTCFGQFNAPTAFQFSYSYILLGNSALCNGQMVTGPAYCSTFNWSPPDTSSTPATLDHYNIYHNDFSSTNLVASVTDTFYITVNGYIGYLWVTAVYTNPAGESDSSNVILNEDLPIGYNEKPAMADVFQVNVFQDRLSITSEKTILYLNIADLNGKIIITKESGFNETSLRSLNSGVYILNIRTVDNLNFRKKIILL